MLSERIRKFSKNEDSGSVHAIGNGKIIAYEYGVNLLQIFGKTYTTPSVLSMEIVMEENMRVESTRKKGMGIWVHEIFIDDKYIGNITDFTTVNNPIFIRQFNLNKEIKFVVKPAEYIKTLNNTDKYKAENIHFGALFTTPAGTKVFAKAVTYQEFFMQMLTIGQVSTIQNSDGTITMCFNPGESAVYFAGGEDYGQATLAMERALSHSIMYLYEKSTMYWYEFSQRRRAFSKLLPKDMPYREELLEAIDSVSVVIKTQQADSGCTLAGYNYHLGYVRDQYGVSRCLLKLGYYDEAKKILEFYNNIFKRNGYIKNAQSIGNNTGFHIHENDDVEITGYLINQGFDYYEKTNDSDFMQEILPMLIWAFTAQTKHLNYYMLPFNGDETYIAGGILPRSVMDEGSFEATMLFIATGKKLLGYLGAEHSVSQQYSEILAETEAHFYKNFINNGEFNTNNVNRLNNLQYPRFRHGVCQNACGYFGHLEKNDSNCYVCPNCIMKNVAMPEWKQYNLRSVSLSPLYMHADFISDEDNINNVQTIIKSYNQTGILPSRPDGGGTVGYDYGMLLYSLAQLSINEGKQLFKTTLDVLDDTGSWVEYYLDNVPYGTRYRPWESGINLEGLIHYVENIYIPTESE